MSKGRIIFLNGVTSSGKTSIVDALQSRRDHFFYVVANDLFQETVGEMYLRENYWKYLSDALIMMYYTARTFSDHGKDILIDGVVFDRPEIAPHYEKIREIFAGYPLEMVEVYCPLEICRQRNLARGDRQEMQSAEQAEVMCKNIDYSFRVDTSVLSPDEAADAIYRHFFFPSI